MSFFKCSPPCENAPLFSSIVNVFIVNRLNDLIMNSVINSVTEIQPIAPVHVTPNLKTLLKNGKLTFSVTKLTFSVTKLTFSVTKLTPGVTCLLGSWRFRLLGSLRFLLIEDHAQPIPFVCREVPI